ncbi:MAG TPA: FAD-dependent oxidoreductase [Bacteroidota bacterium]|nr:FAD-dependent oxidoreductase [Bacteroidota bacterium]
MKNVVIVGGGFAGVQAAIELQKTKTFIVTLISDREYLFLYPTSIWIPTRAATFDDSKISLHEIRRAHGFNLVIDTVNEIRSAQNTVMGAAAVYPYDYLIVAMGAGKMGLPGQEHTFTICGNPESSLAIRDRLDHLIERGSGSIAIGFGGNPKDLSAVRGGPAFELIFNIHTHLKKLGRRDRFSLTFFAPMAEPGARMGKKALRMIDTMFSSMNISKRFGKKIKTFTPLGVTFEDESTLNADLVVFIAGAAGHSVFRSSDLPLNEAGFMKIDDHCLVEGTTNVYAVGDSAAIEGPEWRAKQGHTAEVMARIAAFNIVRSERGETGQKGYQEHLSILCIMDTGNGAAFVYRDRTKNFVIPMPIVGHWMKRAWGVYTTLTKTGKMPRIPGV